MRSLLTIVRSWYSLDKTTNMENNQKGAIALLIIGLLLAASVAGGGVYLFQNRNNLFPQTSSPSNPQQPSQPLTSQQINFDTLSSTEMTEANLNISPDLKSKKQLPDGSVEYLLNSYLLARDNKVILKDNKVTFKRLITVSSDLIHPKISDYQRQNGQPEKVVTGSRFYGPYEQFLIYSSKGLTVVGNPFTDEVDEVHNYLPTSPDDYLKTWADDYLPTPQIITDPY